MCKTINPLFFEIGKINVASRVLTRKNARPPGSHVFQPTSIISELVQDIIGMNLMTKKNAMPLGSHFFQANIIIFELIQDTIETNLLNKFHEDWTINVASRVLTRKNAYMPYTSRIVPEMKDVSRNWTINVASRELTSQMLMPHNARRTKGDHKSSP
ncbi:hypothetical protein DPMN_108965 [Dreissena polymorpha]|uniref:Uncharacterized protein n=1 Tax=Dreissena polymorpha TaxID=45954 RepID=A0A9D4K9F3_DREPO|nr:hypothetical protein DPMN_108965 [Dreissena polymorpha]